MLRLPRAAARFAATTFVAIFAFAAPAFAGTVKIDAADTAWMITATAFVLMMTIPGLALFYAGMVRKKNVLATMAQSLIAVALISILWVIYGYSLVFVGDGAWIGTLDRILMSGMAMDGVNSAAKTIPEALFAIYQMTFAVITVALVAGSVADRMRFSSYVLFCIGWFTVVYIPLAHWVWGGGFLAQAGVLDFAGGLVVHLSAGTAGLVAAVVMGRRRGYGTENLSPHDLSLAVIGTGLLWVGWFGFNGGSALQAGSRAVMAILATHLAACAGALTWTAIEWITRRKPSVLGMISGAVAGLGTITPASGFVEPWHGIVIGGVAGAICFWACTSLKHRFNYDDTLDVFGIHGVGGLLGTLLTGVFATAAIGGTAGLIEGNPSLLLTQAYGVAVVFVWTGGMTFVLLKIVDMLAGLRVSHEHEVEGLDITQHGEALQ
ncbi:ammonium transporter [Bradyrhizobium sp. G127]|uniref:ammonium transporter n=1 Tax=Bradyrhizobium sp. G127 TaxID=2904800 RepID=UPI001F1C8111|nr:ammonium transporter [Bradyrhizobium sp. G127]MCF2521315.1 ammonium transporter [Bradyrhizobium sp. G127]